MTALTSSSITAPTAGKAATAKAPAKTATPAKTPAASTTAASTTAAETAAVQKVLGTDVGAALKNAGLTSALPSSAVSAFVAQLSKDAVAAAQSAKTAKAETTAVSKAVTSDVDAALKNLGLGSASGSSAVKSLIAGLTKDAVAAFDAAKATASGGAASPAAVKVSATVKSVAGEATSPSGLGGSSPKASADVEKVDGGASAGASGEAPSSTSVATRAKASAQGSNPSTSADAKAAAAGGSHDVGTREAGKASDGTKLTEQAADAPSVVRDRDRAVQVQARQASVENAASTLSDILSGSNMDAADLLEKTEKTLKAIVSNLGEADAPALAAKPAPAKSAASTPDASASPATNDNTVSAQHPVLRAYRDSAA